MASFRNNRSGEVINTNLSKAEILAAFSNAPDTNWLWFWLTKHAEESRTAPKMGDMIAFLADSFLYATGMGLKKPMIRLHSEDRRYKIYLSQRGTLCFKGGALIPGTNDPTGDEMYIGCLWNGKFLPNKDRRLLPAEEQFIERLNADPVGFMSQTSKDMDRCCYCGLPLEDQRSKDVGYGAICAVRWGLPWGKSYDEKVPSFAQLWANADMTDRRNIRGICADLRKDPYNAGLWGILGDALEDAGFTKRPACPETNVRMPAA